jgi:fructuronate reductase
VAPYEKVKLRLLNAAHSALAYLGGLAGHEFIAGAAADDAFAALARGLMLRDAAPTVDAPPDMPAGPYAGEALRRFRNAALRHATAQVAMDGSHKLPQRLLGTVADRLAAGATPDRAGLAIAAWMRHVWTQRTESGAPFPVSDPLSDVLAARLADAGVAGDDASQAGAVAGALLGIEEIFGDLSESPELLSLLTGQLERIVRDGARRAAASLDG